MIHVVAQGECLSLIARRYGFRDFRTIYNHPRNASFKKKRPNPNIILPGDKIFIPDKQAKTIGVRTGAEHRFVLKKPRRSIHLVFQNERGEPFANEPYELRGEGQLLRKGETNAAGEIRTQIPLDISELEVEVGTLEFAVHVGHLDPMWDDDTDEPIMSGIQARLANLGFDPGPIDGIWGRRTAHAIRQFELRHGMSPTGEATHALVARLEEDHGC